MISKNHVLVIIILLSSLSGLAQQNLFNVPSSDITFKNKLFFQQQFNINKDLYQSNTTLCYGLGMNAELGFNVIAVDVNPKFSNPLIFRNTDKAHTPVYPLFTVNAQKAFALTEMFKLAIGTQTGLANSSDFGSYSYLNLVTAVTKTQSKIISGIYYGNDTFLGPGERNTFLPDVPVGFQIGIEQTIIHEKLFFIAENISGKHSLGESTIGAAWYAGNHWMLSSGFQFANPHSITSNALVVELTFVPTSEIHKKLYRHGHGSHT